MQNFDDVRQEHVGFYQPGFPVIIAAVFVEARIGVENLPGFEGGECLVPLVRSRNIASRHPRILHGDPAIRIVRLFVHCFKIERQALLRVVVCPQVIRARVFEQLRRVRLAAGHKPRSAPERAYKHRGASTCRQMLRQCFARLVAGNHPVKLGGCPFFFVKKSSDQFDPLHATEQRGFGVRGVYHNRDAGLL